MSRKKEKPGRRKGPHEPAGKKTPLRSAVVWALEIIAVILAAYFLAYFFGQSRTNIGQSMDVTLSGGDRVLLNKLSYQFGSPKRGDVIAFKPGGSESSHSSIKRVVGLPGETVQIKNGMIYINGELYLEQNDFPAMNDAGLAAEGLTLGSGEYFVLGDNRNNSEDSRYAGVGNVRKEYIEGKVWLVASPKERFGIVK